MRIAFVKMRMGLVTSPSKMTPATAQNPKMKMKTTVL